MTRAFTPPTVDGVSASSLVLPPGPWLRLIDYLVHRLPSVGRADWMARMQAGEVIDEHGQALDPEASYRKQTRIYYYRRVAFEHPIPFDETVLFQDGGSWWQTSRTSCLWCLRALCARNPAGATEAQAGH